jgi:hypothetical protein
MEQTQYQRPFRWLIGLVMDDAARKSRSDSNLLNFCIELCLHIGQQHADGKGGHTYDADGGDE